MAEPPEPTLAPDEKKRRFSSNIRSHREEDVDPPHPHPDTNAAPASRPSHPEPRRHDAEAAPKTPSAIALPAAPATPREATPIETRLQHQHEKTRRRIGEHLRRADESPSAGRRPVTAIPPLPADVEQAEFAPIQPDVCYVRIAFDPRTNQHLYQVLEPVLDDAEREIFDLVRDTLVRTMDGRAALDESNWETYLLHALDTVILDHSLPVDTTSRRRLQYYIVRDFLGYGPIDALMRDPMIEDISCDGPNIPLFLFHRQYESIKTNVVFADEPSLDAFVIRLAQRCGKQISIAEPILDATLPDKSRLNASLSREVTTRGSTFTIRRFRADPLTPSDLVRLGTFDARMAAFFWFSMENGASILFAGGTASGKTTTLNAVSIFIPPQKKIVTIEDTREINLPHENWIPGLTRQGFGGELVGGKVVGTIDMYRLLESALRQRPEYLIVGEVRGPEALTLFQAMATGHATYSTLHADSVPSAVYRLENQPINIPRIMLQTLGAIAIHTSTRVGPRMVRRIKELVEIAGIDPESKDLLTNTVFTWDPSTDTYAYTGKSNILDRIAERRSLGYGDIEREWENRTRVIQWMVDNGIRKLDDVVNLISAYYSDPKGVLERVRAAGGTPRAP